MEACPFLKSQEANSGHGMLIPGIVKWELGSWFAGLLGLISVPYSILGMLSEFARTPNSSATSYACLPKPAALHMKARQDGEEGRS